MFSQRDSGVGHQANIHAATAEDLRDPSWSSFSEAFEIHFDAEICPEFIGSRDASQLIQDIGIEDPSNAEGLELITRRILTPLRQDADIDSMAPDYDSNRAAQVSIGILQARLATIRVKDLKPEYIETLGALAWCPDTVVFRHYGLRIRILDETAGKYLASTPQGLVDFSAPVENVAEATSIDAFLGAVTEEQSKTVVAFSPEAYKNAHQTYRGIQDPGQNSLAWSIRTQLAEQIGVKDPSNTLIDKYFEAELHPSTGTHYVRNRITGICEEAPIFHSPITLRSEVNVPEDVLQV